MQRFTHQASRLTLSLCAATMMLLSPVRAYANATAGAQEQSRNLGPGNIPVAGRFLQEWSRQGSEQASVYVNGWPITERRPEISLEDGKTYDVQWFERARYEAHPEHKAPYDVLLARLGATLVEGRGRVDPNTRQVRNRSDLPFLGTAPPPDADSKSKAWFQETGHSLSGKFLEQWNRYGGLAQFGFPLSEQFEEVSPTDGKTYTVQYFERNRFELHPGNPAPYDVELGLLGVQQHLLTPVPSDQLPIAPPKGVTSSKDTFVQGSFQEPTSLVGFEKSTVVAARFLDAITFQDRLVHADDKGNWFPLAAWYVPSLENAGSYFVGAGEDRHLVTKYKLRPGIKWSDGVELTSNDAVFAYSLLLRDPHAVSTERLKKLASVDNPDKYTLIYNWLSSNEARARYESPGLDKVEYDFLRPFIEARKPVVDRGYFIVGAVLPEHVLGTLPVEKLQETDYARAPVGYGPYIVQSWKRGEEMVLVANPNYNLTAKPLIKRVISRFQVDMSFVSQFLTNNLDGYSGEVFAAPPEQCPQIEAANGRCDSIPGPMWEHLEFSFTYPPFQDRRVRQAIMQAINRGQLAHLVYRDSALVNNSPVPPSVYFSLENPNFAAEFPELAAKYHLPVYPYDPVAASRLLDEAGWVRGADGIRAKGGERLSFEYGTTRNVLRQAVQAHVQADLKAVGIEAVPVNYPQGFFPPSGPLGTGKTKLAQFAYEQNELTDFRQFSTDPVKSSPDPMRRNFQQYSNDRVTEAARVVDSEIDRGKIAEAAAIIQVEVMNDIAVVPLVQRANIEVYRRTLENRKLSNGIASQWWNIVQWYFN
ncbi:MAG TPA: ABC transporter substrate-binding protein [Chloroflexia bacterium]